MNEKLNIMEITKRNQMLSTFARALAAVDLDALLQKDGPFTVLAPSNEALGRLPGFEDLIRSDNKEQLKSLLSSQIFKGRVAYKDFGDKDGIETVSGRKLAVKDSSGLAADKWKVVNSNIEAANGVLHILDNVVMPQPAASQTARA
ncbi:MAG: fasciclin domain-containing protein [Pyrinomonadaceae bacterium]